MQCLMMVSMDEMHVLRVCLVYAKAKAISLRDGFIENSI